MTGPRRLLEDPSIPSGSRALLRAGSQLRLATDQKGKVWAGISAATAVVSAGTTAGATLAKIGASAIGMKVMMAVAVLGAFGTGAVLAVGLSPQPSKQALVQAPVVEKAPPSQPGESSRVLAIPPADSSTTQSSDEPPSPKGSALVDSTRALAVDPVASTILPSMPAPAMSGLELGSAPPSGSAQGLSASSRISQLREESAAVAHAREELQRGRPAECLRILNAISVAVPSGMLMQEREKIAIEALVASGQREAAKSRARAFLARYPGSAHAAAVRPFAE